MSDMVELVAWTLYTLAEKKSWEREPENILDQFRTQARAAIARMREMTLMMAKEGTR